MMIKRKTTFKKTLKRRIVASGIVSGQSTKAIARDANTSQRTVQRIAAESETQLLITEAFRPHNAKLYGLAVKVVNAIEKGLGAMKTDKQDHQTRLKAVERYGDVIALAQGKVVEKPVEAKTTFTWEEFTEIV
jgi:transposase-like protein